MTAEFAQFNEMKKFLQFAQADIDNLVALSPVFEKHGGAITNGFYDTLAKFPATAALIEGRVEALKKTHDAWMMELFSGDYGEAYFDRRVKIGMVHVGIGLPPYYVEAVMNHIRSEGQLAVHEERPEEAAQLIVSMLKILDLDLILINLAYAEERLDRVASFTGMSRKLIENVINRAKK